MGGQLGLDVGLAGDGGDNDGGAVLVAHVLMTSHSGPGCRGQIGLLSYKPDSGTGLWKRSNAKFAPLNQKIF